jgi:hypothetical protein
MNANFEIAAHHIGWGDPAESGLFFVGIEETLHWRPEDLERYTNANRDADGATYDPVDGANSDRKQTQTQIPQWVSKIACQVSQTRLDWREYRSTRLWLPDSHVFNANLLPLGKPRMSDWPDDYKRLFDLGRSDMPAYQSAVQELRYPVLRRFWRRYKPVATVAFGESHWSGFEAAFELQGSGSARHGSIKAHPSEQFILAPFFGLGHMSDAIAANISQQLLAWGVSVP